MDILYRMVNQVIKELKSNVRTECEVVEILGPKPVKEFTLAKEVIENARD